MEKKTRPETGAMQFEGDWQGVYMRGDSAEEYARLLQRMVGNMPRSWDREVLLSLVAVLSKAREASSEDVQGLLPFEACSKR